jgi:exo-beta-1,3-glucanase (GH17 family)
VSLITGIIAQLLNLVNWQTNWPWVFLLFAVSFALMRLFRGFRNLINAVDENRKKGIEFFAIACVAIIVFGAWDQVVGPILSGYFVSDADVNLLIRGHRWITYAPLHYDPSLYPNPDVDSMAREIKQIRSAGFDGIMTFTSRGTFSMIPELAKKEGLTFIMGVWDPTDRQEIAVAISKREYVDGYSVGHNGLNSRYPYDDLVRAMQYIRFRTKRPVSTTEKVGLYLEDKRLLAIGDWVFPDVHVSIRSESASGFLADAVRDGKNTVDMAKLIATQKETDGKPILLKMVTYPMSGISNASLDEQRKFFAEILERRRDVLVDMPGRVSISVHSAFDIPWKTTWPFYEWDPYTGLLDSTGTPRPAAREIVRMLP